MIKHGLDKVEKCPTYYQEIIRKIQIENKEASPHTCENDLFKNIGNHVLFWVLLKKKLSFTVGYVNWCSLYGKVWRFFKNLKRKCHFKYLNT